MNSQKIVGALAVVALFAATQSSAEAQYYSGGYTTFYAPSTSYYNGGYTSYYGGGGYGSGYGYTSYYGGSSGYGGNPFAPLVASPYRYGWGGWFGTGYTAAYGPSGYGYGGGCCSPCGVGCSGGGCATGNCSVPASSEQRKPTPDNGVPMDEGPMPKTYDDGTDMPPVDDKGFRRGGTGIEETETENFPGGIEPNESFKIPMSLDELDETDLPKEKSQPDTPLDADKPSVPDVLYVPTTKPITPNSARVEPASHLDRRITWRSQPVIVPEQAKSTASRPLIVRKTVRVQLNPAPTLVSQSNSDR